MTLFPWHAWTCLSLFKNYKRQGLMEPWQASDLLYSSGGWFWSPGPSASDFWVLGKQACDTTAGLCGAGLWAKASHMLGKHPNHCDAHLGSGLLLLEVGLCCAVWLLLYTHLWACTKEFSEGSRRENACRMWALGWIKGVGEYSSISYGHTVISCLIFLLL